MNSVSPSAVSTGFLDDFVSAFGHKASRNVARTGRPGRPNEIADVIAWLILPQSHWLKGQAIVVDGGMEATTASDVLRLADTLQC